MRTLILTLTAGTLFACFEQEPRSVTTSAPMPDFEAQFLDSIQIGYGLQIGDVDGDGTSDIILADKKEFVWYRNGDWQRFVMAENLTERDNVCIAARDINGDGQVEVAVGARWNPGETSDLAASGSVHYLVRPEDPTERWQPVQLHHEPTIHRMRWVSVAPDRFDLVVVPLHGVGNQRGEGAGVKIYAYEVPDNPEDEWTLHLIDDQMHMTHNFDLVESDGSADLYIAGREGIRRAQAQNGAWTTSQAAVIDGLNSGAGEVRYGTHADQTPFLTAIESMHGTDLTVYNLGNGTPERQVLDTTFVQGHALATADLLGLGGDQIVAGWRNPNAEEKVGIKLYVPDDETGTGWTSHSIDDNTMAVEDLKVADLNADGKLDIIAAGRATNNLIIYWNRTAF